MSCYTLDIAFKHIASTQQQWAVKDEENPINSKSRSLAMSKQYKAIICYVPMVYGMYMHMYLYNIHRYYLGAQAWSEATTVGASLIIKNF